MAKSKDSERDIFQTERETYHRRADDERVKTLEKEKGELLIKI